MGKQWKQWQILFFGAPKSLQMVTEPMKLKHLEVFLGGKVMTNLDSILKSRGFTLQTKVRLVKALIFPVVMYGCESWTIKKAESQRIDAFELWCWKRLLRVPWTARRSNQSILKEISPGIFIWRTDAEAETPNDVKFQMKLQRTDAKLQLQAETLATWCNILTHWKRPWCWERLKGDEKGMTEDEMIGWYHRLDGHEFE